MESKYTNGINTEWQWFDYVYMEQQSKQFVYDIIMKQQYIDGINIYIDSNKITIY